MLRRGGGRPHRRAACAYLRGSSGHVVVAPPRFVTNSGRRMANPQGVRDGVSKFSAEILPELPAKGCECQGGPAVRGMGVMTTTQRQRHHVERASITADGPYRVITTPRHDPQNSVAAWRNGDSVIQRLSPSQWSYLAEPVVVPAGAAPEPQPCAVPHVVRCARSSARHVARADLHVALDAAACQRFGPQPRKPSGPLGPPRGRTQKPIP